MRSCRRSLLGIDPAWSRPEKVFICGGSGRSLQAYNCDDFRAGARDQKAGTFPEGNRVIPPPQAHSEIALIDREATACFASSPIEPERVFGLSRSGVDQGGKAPGENVKALTVGLNEMDRMILTARRMTPRQRTAKRPDSIDFIKKIDKRARTFFTLVAVAYVVSVIAAQMIEVLK